MPTAAPTATPTPVPSPTGTPTGSLLPPAELYATAQSGLKVDLSWSAGTAAAPTAELG